MIKIHCVAPLILEDIGLENFEEKINELIHSKEYDFHQINRNTDINIESDSRYTTLSEDSILGSSIFKEITYHNNSKQEVRFYLKDKIVLISMFCIYEDNIEDYEELQIEINNNVNNMIVIFRNKLGLNSIENKNYYHWVTRTLICSEEYFIEFKEQITRKWLYSFINDSKIILSNKFFIAWGNCLVLDDIDRDILSNFINSIVLTGYYYLVLDDANNKLRDVIDEIDDKARVGGNYILNINSVPKSKAEIMITKNKLLEMKHSIGVLISRYEDDIISLQSYKKFFTKNIMKINEFDNLLATIERKIELIEDILSEIEYNLKVKSIFITDFILFFIALSGLLSFTLYLGEIMDNQIEVEMVGFSDILNHFPAVINQLTFSSFIGVLNMITFIMSLVLMVVYLRHRKS